MNAAKKDIAVLIRIKNNNLLSRREALGFTQEAMAKEIGLAGSRYGKLENLKEMPIRKDMSWNDAAKKCSDYFNCPPEDLFPEYFQYITKTWAKIELTAAQTQSFLNPAVNTPVIETPEDALRAKEGTHYLQQVVRDLTLREQKTVNMYFGLDGDGESTFDEIAEEFFVTRTRIRQVFDKAMRKMRFRAALGEGKGFKDMKINFNRT